MACQLSGSQSTEEQVVVDTPGGYKRCGGQGDILSGAVGTIMAWGKCYEEGAYGCVFHPSDVSVQGAENSRRCV